MSLRHPQRDIVIQMDADGNSPAVIAGALGLSRGSVSSILARVRGNLTAEQRREMVERHMAGQSYWSIGQVFRRRSDLIQGIVADQIEADRRAASPLPPRFCNLCLKGFTPQNKFQRFCVGCRGSERLSCATVGGIYF